MTASIENRTSGYGSAAVRRSYDKMPLAQLACAITQRNDREALLELHENRRVFQSQSGRCVLMAEFLLELKDYDLTLQWCGRDPVVDQAYDLTLAKFHDLPSDSQHDLSARPSGGPNCYFYYTAFQEHIIRDFQRRPPASVIDAEVWPAWWPRRRRRTLTTRDRPFVLWAGIDSRD